MTLLILFPLPTAFAFVTTPFLESPLLAIPLTRLSAHTTFVDGLLTLLIRTDIPTLDMLQLRLLRNPPVVVAVELRDDATLPLSDRPHLLVARLIGIIVLRGTIADPELVYVINVRVPDIGHFGMFEVPIAINSSRFELPHAPVLEMVTIRPLEILLSIPRAGLGIRIIHVSGTTNINMYSIVINGFVRQCYECMDS